MSSSIRAQVFVCIICIGMGKKYCSLFIASAYATGLVNVLYTVTIFQTHLVLVGLETGDKDIVHAERSCLGDLYVCVGRL